MARIKLNPVKKPNNRKLIFYLICIPFLISIIISTFRADILTSK